MQKIKCACGHEGDKDYGKATEVVMDSGDLYRRWTCSECGQQYIEKAKRPIELINE